MTLLEYLIQRMEPLSPVMARLREIASKSNFVQFGTGQMTARAAIATFGVRRWSLRLAGIDSIELGSTISALETAAATERINLLKFESIDSHLILFVGAEPERIFGFVTVKSEVSAWESGHEKDE